MKERSLSFYTWTSFGLHSAVVVMMILLSAVFLHKKNNIRRYNMKLLQSSVRVDVVALPDRTLKELKSLRVAKPSAPEKAVAKSVPQSTSKSLEKSDISFKKKTSFSDMLKKYSNNKKVLNKKTKKKARRRKTKVKESPSLDNLKGLIAKGNQVQSGSALTGEASQEAQDEFDRYALSVIEEIKPFWKLPSYLKDQQLRCLIQIYIGKTGKVLRKKITLRSGVKEYDERAMSSIDQAGSFPAPTSNIVNRVSRGDIELAFPL